MQGTRLACMPLLADEILTPAEHSTELGCHLKIQAKYTGITQKIGLHGPTLRGN
jgi:hypothetical protein